ncbi:MAG: DNA polymerase III subunit delta' [Planctomycetia bacterium]|nr:DNA polymerase III subunit delta' [Planctomycetia bacterium]
MWQGIVGHDDVVEQFRRRYASGRVTGTFLFVGPAGVGKRSFAGKLAQALLCRGGTALTLDPCGTCEDCRLVAAGNHPDLIGVAKPNDKSEIPLELLIGRKENRNHEGLCHDIAMKPFRGGRRIAVIDDADFLNEEGANALLKTLEEPPPKSMLILIGTGSDRQLPTIRSRSQIVRFRPLAAVDLARLIRQAGLVDSEEDAERLALLAEGSLAQAARLADPALSAFRREWLEQLSSGEWDSQTAAKMLVKFAEDAGKEASQRRERLRLGIGFLVDFFRAMLHLSTGAAPREDAELEGVAKNAARDFHVDAETLAAVIERCLDGVEHVDRNAHHVTLVDAMCDDIAKILAGAPTSAH